MLEQVLVLLIDLLHDIGIVLGDFSSHLLQLCLPLRILRLENILLLLKGKDGLLEESHLFVAELNLLALHLQPAGLLAQQLHRLLPQLNHRLLAVKHSNYNHMNW
jgi:hypothetical protein